MKCEANSNNFHGTACVVRNYISKANNLEAAILKYGYTIQETQNQEWSPMENLVIKKKKV